MTTHNIEGVKVNLVSKFSVHHLQKERNLITKLSLQMLLPENEFEMDDESFCAKCERVCDFKESYLVMKQTQLMLVSKVKVTRDFSTDVPQPTLPNHFLFQGSGTHERGGYLCPKCVLGCTPYMGNLLVSTKDSEDV